MIQLSDISKNIWAKYSSVDGLWLPLYVHMSDIVGVSESVWDKWVPDHIRRVISNSLKGVVDPKALFKFVAASHDLGKATPGFEYSIVDEHSSELILNRIRAAGLLEEACIKSRHEHLSYFILIEAGVSSSVSMVCGGHHGKYPSKCDLNRKNITRLGGCAWNQVQKELLQYAIDLSGVDVTALGSIRIGPEIQILLTALVIMCDWIASSEDMFPLIDQESSDCDNLSERADAGLTCLNLPGRWITECPDDVFKVRFGNIPRPFQTDLCDYCRSLERPGLLIVEAPMGEGKTEAALASAEILRQKFDMGGIMFALPTQATSDGIFERVLNWIVSTIADDDQQSIFLAHGKSRFNPIYAGLPRSSSSSVEDSVVINEWLSGRKRGLLNSFVIGTIDQALMVGLRQKHNMLRHLGLSGKVVIVDECHSYDAYMNSYLCKVLSWLGAYKVPVILLSATLNSKLRKEFICGYSGLKEPIIPDEGYAYPRVTYSDTDGNVEVIPSVRSGRSLEVAIGDVSSERLLDFLDEKTDEGGFIGVFVNSVRSAQTLYRSLVDRFGKRHVRLLHSRFTSMDRSENEQEVFSMLRSGDRLSKGDRLFVIGTQVMEQSLDLDYDLIITELCPIDLLLQRIGRLHRHANSRSRLFEKAECLILDRDGSVDRRSVYSRLQMRNSEILLDGRKSVVLPDDIPVMVESAYSGENLEESPEYLEYVKEDHMERDKKDRKARNFQVKGPTNLRTLEGWHDGMDESDENLAYATVRDTRDSVEMVVIQSLSDGLHTLPWVDGGASLSDGSISSDLAFTLAGCKVSCSTSLIGGTDAVLNNLKHVKSEFIPRSWDDSDWLYNELYLVLGENMECRMNGKTLRYSRELGLEVI